jgi:putative ABC transport system permease protein
MDQVAAELEQEYPDTNRGWGVKVVSAHQTVVGDVRTALWTLMGAVGFVLLIACANVANLQLSRQATRQQELAIRNALGAGLWRVMRQVLVENLLLTLLGSACAMGFATFAVEGLKRLYPGEVPRLVDAQVNGAVLAFAIGLAVVTALVLAVASAPPWSGRASMDDALKEGRRGLAGGRKLELLRRVSVTAQVALALVLLVGGGLLAQSFLRVVSVEPGFRMGNLLTFNVWPTTAAYREQAQQKDYIRRSLERLRSVSGVEAVAAISQVPLSQGRTALKFEVEGKPLPRENAPEADYRSVSPNYFDVVGIPILRGRLLTSFDREESRKVAVINETMARRFWPGDDPVGKRIRWADPERDIGWLAVVGVVGDVKSQGLDAEERPAVYVPYPQRTHPHMRWTGFMVRTQGDAAALWPSVRQVFVDLDPTVPVYDVRTMDDLMESSVAERRFYAYFLGAFAIVALILGAVGIYGVISYSVSRRTHEMGLRMALGAQSADVMRLVIRQGMKPAVLGLGVGAISALGLTRWMESMLFEINATDPLTFLGVIVGLGITALVACAVPALRATRVDPSTALRHE